MLGPGLPDSCWLEPGRTAGASPRVAISPKKAKESRPWCPALFLAPGQFHPPGQQAASLPRTRRPLDGPRRARATVRGRSTSSPDDACSSKGGWRRRPRFTMGVGITQGSRAECEPAPEVFRLGQSPSACSNAGDRLRHAPLSDMEFTEGDERGNHTKGGGRPTWAIGPLRAPQTSRRKTRLARLGI